jgi:hypothetical protein
MQIKFKNIKRILQGNTSKDKIYPQRKSNKIKLLMQKGSRIKDKVLGKNRKKRGKTCMKIQNNWKKNISDFQANIQIVPKYVCSCCCRQLYRQSAVTVDMNNYKHKEVVKTCLTETLSDLKEYICKTCQKTLKRGKIPSQAQCNSLKLDDIPEELSELCDFFLRLIAQRIPLMKIVNLPTCTQKGIKGTVANVTADLSKVTYVLPRAVSDTGLVTLKLKRKLSYQSHVLQQIIRPEAIMIDLTFLKSHNPLYTKISINPEWMNDVNEEDTGLFDSTDTISAELSDHIISSKSLRGGESEHTKIVNNTPENIAGDNSVDQFEPQPGCSH